MKNYLHILFFWLAGLAFSTAGPGPDYQVGDVVADFSLKNVDGRIISLSDYAGQKGVIVVFTCNHCPFAKAYESRIGALNQQFVGQAFPVLAINPSDPTAHTDDTIEMMGYRAKTKNFVYPYLADPSQRVARLFGATHTPQTFVLKNEGGRFVVHYIGTIDDNPQDPNQVAKPFVADAVEALLAGRPVAVDSTKPIGCVIKWKDM